MFFPLAAKRVRASSPRTVLARSVLALGLSLLMSCGGGGGGGGDDDGGGNNFRVTLDRNSVSWTFYQGADVPAAQNITGTATGTFNGQLFVAATIENNGAVNAINPNITISISGTRATASVQPVAGLAAGTYTGRIQFLACSDAACNNRIGGTPLPVNFTVTVQTGVQATPGAITNSAESGNTVVADIAVTPGVNETGFTIGATTAFVQITNQTAGGFRVTLPSLPVGVYDASIALTGSNGSRSSVPIAYTVTAPPGGQQLLSVTPSNVTLTAAEGASSAPAEVQVTEATWRPGLRAPVIEYREGQNWLNIAPVQGGYNFVANAANLSIGTYTAIVFIANNELPQGINEPFGNSQQVFVSVTVGPGLVQPADVVRVITSATRDFELTGLVDIDLAGGLGGGPQVTWNATSDVPWMFVSASGTTGESLTFEIQQLWLSTAENFAEHVANITVTAPGTVITPITFPIRVQRRLAAVTGVGAHVQLSGQPTTLVVSGRGFDAFEPTAIGVVSDAASASSVQRVSDTKVLLTYDSFSTPGTYRMLATSRLGYDTAEGSFVVVAPTAYTYDTVATGGAIAHLAVDHETGTLYGVRLEDAPEEGSLVRFRSSGGNWTADSPSISAVGNVGVLNDGNVIVNTVPGGLTILDRDTMNSTFTLDLSCTGLHHKSPNMPVTLDGRVWLSRSLINPGCAGSPRWGELGRFDPQTEAFQLFETPNEPWFVGRFANGPSFVMSRNGERLVMHQESNQNFPPMVYLDASESVLRPTPQDQPNWFQTAASSDDGSRMLFDHDRLVNDEFATVGRVEIPEYSLPFTDAAFRAASVLSPDGSRAYVLTYPVSFIGQETTPTSPLPRVWVLDTSGDVGDAPLPVEGYFEIEDAPSCLQSGCAFSSRAAVSIDGATLFFAGNERMVIAPIPSVLTTSFVAEPNGRMQTKAKPWRLPQH